MSTKPNFPRPNFRRIINETKRLEQDKETNREFFTVSQVDDDMFHWEATIYGPVDSLYQGYGFDLDIKLPDDYPNSPINIKFTTPIEHVNVNKKGDICMDILKTEWSSALNIGTLLLSVISLLSSPNIKDPLNSDLAELYRKNQKTYERKIIAACKAHGKPKKNAGGGNVVEVL